MVQFILSPMEIQANDHVPYSSCPNSLPTHHCHSLFRCIKHVIEDCHARYELDPPHLYSCIELRSVTCLDYASKNDPIYSDVKFWRKVCNLKFFFRKIEYVASCFMEYFEKLEME